MLLSNKDGIAEYRVRTLIGTDVKVDNCQILPTLMQLGKELLHQMRSTASMQEELPISLLRKAARPDGSWAASFLNCAKTRIEDSDSLTAVLDSTVSQETESQG